MNEETQPAGLVRPNDGLGPLLAEWADAACVRFVSRSSGQRTTDTVSKDDLLQLMRAAQAAERERCALLAVDAAAAAVKKYEDDPAPVRQPYANNRLMHVGWAAADLIRGPNDVAERPGTQ